MPPSTRLLRLAVFEFTLRVFRAKVIHELMIDKLGVACRLGKRREPFVGGRQRRDAGETVTATHHGSVERQRARTPAAPAKHSADAPSPDVQPPSVRHLLKLQRLVGNESVTRLLRKRGARPIGSRIRAVDRTVVQRNPPTPQEQATALAGELHTLIVGATWKEIRKRVYPKESAAGIKRAKERKTGKLPDLTGLGQVKTLDHFATAVRDVQKKWPAMNSDERKTALADAINAEMVAAGIPKFVRVDPIKTDFKGSFSRGAWRFNISQDLLANSPLSDADAAELCNTALHEARHAEQAFLAARFAAGQSKKTDRELADLVGMPEPIAREANKQKFDTKTDATVADLGKRMFKAGVTDRDKNQQISDDDGLSELDDRRKEAATARAAVLGSATSQTIADAKKARDALKAQIADVEKRYTDYRNIPYEADAHEVGDAAEQAFKGWP
jgi:hypothetical protein